MSDYDFNYDFTAQSALYNVVDHSIFIRDRLANQVNFIFPDKNNNNLKIRNEHRLRNILFKEIQNSYNNRIVIYGLNLRMLDSSIDKKSKLKIYISPFTPIGLDRHNHISTTDLRLLRRMVRDNRTRGYAPEVTLENWAGMRESEEKYVYPYQSEADVIVNTSLAYEIGVLRTYAEPLLYSISKDSEYYEEAMRILSFLKGFINIPSEGVPSTSVLREFIGNSYFE